MDVTVKVEGLEELQRRFRQIPPEFIKRSGAGLKQVLLQAQKYTTTTHLRGAGASTLAKRTGMLARSLRSRVDVKGQTVDGEYGSYDSNYAALHEFGHPNITPKRARALWIPLAANKTAAGVPRWSPRQAIEDGAYSTDPAWRSGVVMSAKGVPLFALRQRVSVPARPFIKPTFERNIVPRYSKVLNDLLNQAVSA